MLGPVPPKTLPPEGPSGAQVGGPKWVGPSWAQARTLGPKKSQNQKFSKSKSVLPKMLAMFLLAGKRPSRPHLGPSQVIFCVGRKNKKKYKKLPIFLGGLIGPHPVWARLGCRCCHWETYLGTTVVDGMAK